MRSALAVVGFVAAVIGAASCLVDRRANDFACDRDEDCAALGGGRTCDTSVGYCVVPTCPAECTGGCNAPARTCNINCSALGTCSDVACPSGYACTIACNSSGACSSVDCSDAASCTIQCASPNTCGSIDCGNDEARCTVSCSGTNSCSNVSCGDGACQVTCLGNNSCSAVDCNDSCACDVTCSGGGCSSVTCADVACALAPGCSSALPGCSTCTL